MGPGTQNIRTDISLSTRWPDFPIFRTILHECNRRADYYICLHERNHINDGLVLNSSNCMPVLSVFAYMQFLDEKQIWKGCVKI